MQEISLVIIAFHFLFLPEWARNVSSLGVSYFKPLWYFDIQWHMLTNNGRHLFILTISSVLISLTYDKLKIFLQHQEVRHNEIRLCAACMCPLQNIIGTAKHLFVLIKNIQILIYFNLFWLRPKSSSSCNTFFSQQKLEEIFHRTDNSWIFVTAGIVALSSLKL